MKTIGLFLRTGSTRASALSTAIAGLGGELIQQSIRYFAPNDLLPFAAVLVEAFGEKRTEREEDVARAYLERGAIVFILFVNKQVTIEVHLEGTESQQLTFPLSVLDVPAKLSVALQEAWDAQREMQLNADEAEAPVAPKASSKAAAKDDAEDDAPASGVDKKAAAAALNALTVDDLKALAKEKGVEVPSKANKTTLVDALIEAGVTGV